MGNIACLLCLMIFNIVFEDFFEKFHLRVNYLNKKPA